MSGKQAVRNVEDGFRHAVADREISDGAIRSEMGEHVRPAFLTRRRGGLGDIPNQGARSAGCAPTDHPERHRRVVLRLVDHHMAVGERRAIEQRVRFVDEMLIGGGPLDVS